jgi:hypothetical protein
MGWRRVEGVRLTHPLRHEPLPTGFGHDPVMSGALELRPRRHDHPLAVQRVIRILNDDFLDVMMGSMEYRRSVGRNRC